MREYSSVVEHLSVDQQVPILPLQLLYVNRNLCTCDKALLHVRGNTVADNRKAFCSVERLYGRQANTTYSLNVLLRSAFCCCSFLFIYLLLAEFNHKNPAFKHLKINVFYLIMLSSHSYSCVDNKALDGRAFIYSKCISYKAS